MRQGRTYYGAEHADPLIRILNSQSDSNAKKRISDGIRLAKEMRSMLASGKSLPPSAIDKLNDWFAQYRLTPQFKPSMECVWTQRGREEHEELDAFLVVHDLLAYSEEFANLDYLIQCANCSRWFYKKFEHQLCCSQECREQYGRRPEILNRRAEQMRLLRQKRKLRGAKKKSR